MTGAVVFVTANRLYLSSTLGDDVRLLFDGSDELLLVDYATLLDDGYLYSFQRRISKEAYSKADQHPNFAMVRTAADGSSDFTQLRDDGYVLGDVLWAVDGSGAVIVPEVTAEADSLPVLWLAADNRAGVTLPVPVRNDYISLLRWGAPDS